MKKILSFLALGLLLAVSCEKEGPTTVNEITDLYSVPADAKVMTFTSGDAKWSTDRRYFELIFSDITTTLVGYDALLAPGQYVLGGDEIGNAIAAKTKVNGQTPSEGWFTVNNRDGQYQITAHFGDDVYYWTGTLPFIPDPDPTRLTEVLSAQSNKQNGQNSLTMNLATPGISQEFDMTTYQQVWVGDGNYLALDIYSDDGYLHDGTFKASAEGGVINPGEFGIGYDGVYSMQWGDQTYEIPFENWGTCWWTVKDGAATAEKITDGVVNVSSREEQVDGKDVTIWTISWGKEYPVEIIFEGAIPALTKPKKPDGPVVPDYLYTDTVTPGETFDLHAISITDKDGNEMAYVELLTEPGATDLSGSYPSTSYAGQPGQMRDGYDGGSYGEYTWEGGGSYYIENGEQKYLYQGTATVIVTPIATGAYNFACEFFNYNAAGPDYVPEGGGDFDGIELTQFGGVTNYYQLYGGGVNLVGIEMATEGVTITPGGWGNTYGGDGNYLKLEFYTADGSIAPGTYTPCAEGGVLTEGTFGIGYTGSWGASGTTWYTLAGGAATYEYVTDGTLVIKEAGGVYDITLTSSVVNCHYSGPLE